MSFSGGAGGLLIAGLVFSGLNRLLKPVLKLVLLPFNLLTFGLLSGLVQVIVLLVSLKFLPSLQLAGFTTSGWHQAGFSVPPLTVHPLLNLLFAGWGLNLIYRLLDNLL